MTATSFPEIEHEILAGIRAEVKVPQLYDLGSGDSPAEGFVGVDLYATAPGIMKADMFADVWPFADETVDYLASSHFTEHVPDWNAHFRAAYACLKPDGFYRIIGPFAWNDRALQDPTHRQWLLPARFAYLDQAWRRANGIDHYLAPVNFSIAFMGYVWDDDYADKPEEARQWALRRYINVVSDIIVILQKEPLLP